MKILMTAIMLTIFIAGCSSKPAKPAFDQQSYQRQNEAAQKSLDAL